MPTPAELEAKFWKALKSDRTALLGLSKGGDGHAQPMTAQIEGDEGGPIWFFSAGDVELVEAIGGGAEAFLHFAAKGHDLFASVDGRLAIDNDRTTIERPVESVRRRMVRGRQGRSQAAAAALRTGQRANLAQREQPVRGRQDAARRRSEGGLQGQGRGNGSQLTARRKTASVRNGSKAAISQLTMLPCSSTEFPAK